MKEKKVQSTKKKVVFIRIRIWGSNSKVIEFSFKSNKLVGFPFDVTADTRI